MKSQNKIKLRDVLNYTNLYSYIESVNNPYYEENINRNILHQDNHYYNLKFQDHNIISSFIPKEEIKDKDYKLQLQFIIKKLITSIQPINLNHITKGKKHFLNTLSLNELQCFENAGLLNNNEENVIIWWDDLISFQRSIKNNENVIKGRTGERKSFEYEKNKLRKLSINLIPSWDSLEDDTLGYDITSYNELKEEIFIECKYSESKINNFHLSNREYNRALGKKEFYFVHYWNSSNVNPIIIDFYKLKELVLENKDNTEWVDIHIKNF